jgi:hypothetical protein
LKCATCASCATFWPVEWPECLFAQTAQHFKSFSVQKIIMVCRSDEIGILTRSTGQKVAQDAQVAQATNAYPAAHAPGWLTLHHAVQ